MITQNTVDIAKDGSAWKTVTMRGYWKKTTLDAEKFGKNAFKLTIVKAAGEEYDFYFNLDTSLPDAQVAIDSTGVELDGELLRHLLTSQWQNGTADDYEIVRGGAGEW